MILRFSITLLFFSWFSLLTGFAEEWYPGRILLKPKPGVSSVQLENLHLTSGCTLKTLIMAGDEPWQLVEFSPLEDVSGKIREYLKSGLIQDACPDYLVHAAIVPCMPNDPSTQNATTAFNVPLVEAPSAWDTIHDAGDVVVAVVDGGVRYTHEDLADNMWVNTGEIPDNGIDDDKNGYVDDVHGVNLSDNVSYSEGNPMDEDGHGSHIAGIIGATGNNGLGIAGMAWKTRLMACKFMSNRTGSLSGGVQCLVYARKNGAQIINASWVVGSVSSLPILKTELQSLRKNGIILVCAAGNESMNLDDYPQYPAAYTTEFGNVISVGNSTASDTRYTGSSGSNYSKTKVNLFAPGCNIYSTFYGSDKSYSRMTGTSMSTPHVAGAIALYKQLHPTDSYSTIRTKLFDSVDTISDLSDYCSTGGRLNIGRFITGKRTPQIAWATPASITYGTPLGDNQLNAYGSVEGSFEYNPAGGTVLNAGANTLTAIFTPMDETGYLTVQKNISLTVDQAEPVIYWPTPDSIEYGVPLSETQLNAEANVPGSYLYSPEAGTILEVGKHSLFLTFNPEDSINYLTVEASTTLTIEEPTPVVKPVLAISVDGNYIVITWDEKLPKDGIYYLQESTKATGEWITLTEAVSGYRTELSSNSSRFYRLVYIP